MARIEKGKYVANKSILVSQATIDNMKRMGMSKAIERANSGQASEEEVEGARRFYGNRVTGTPKKAAPTTTYVKGREETDTPVQTKYQEQEYGHMRGEAVPAKKAKPYGKNESAI